MTTPALLRPVLTAAGLAAVGVAATHLLFDAAGADFVVAPGGQDETTVPAVQAALVALLGVLVGGGLAALVASRTRRPARWFTVAVVAGLVLMSVNPVLAADQLLTVVALEVEHLVAAAAALVVLLPVLRRRAASRPVAAPVEQAAR